MRNCATCRRWTGTAIPNTFCSWVEIDTHETGKCMGGTYHICNMFLMKMSAVRSKVIAVLIR